jgi:hypothetical protein
MAINPNTDFTVSAVLTAAQQNRFPRGIMAYTTNTTANNSVTSEAVQITSASFTAVANRYYKITYFEPDPVGGTGYFAFRIRQTNLAGTQLQIWYQQCGTGIDRHANGVWIGTFSAGTVTVVATAQQTAGTGILNRSAQSFAFLSVEDIGPA